MTDRRPTCWSCGYDLVGLKVEARCPECGQPVWPGGTLATPTIEAAKGSATWGVWALILFFTCLGPWAGLLGVRAVTLAYQARKEQRIGRYPESALAGSGVGMICGWLAIALAALTLLLALVGVKLSVFWKDLF